MMSCPEFDDIIGKFNNLTQKPVKYLTVQTEVKEDIKNFVKSLYDYTKSQEPDDIKSKSTALPELIVKDFDEEQIWQEIELQNSTCFEKLVRDVANCMTFKDNFKFPLKFSSPEDEINSEENELDSHLTDDADNQEIKKKDILGKKLKTFKPSLVDDDFFKLNEMEQFLLKEERKDSNSQKHESESEEDIDMFEKDDEEMEEDGCNDIMYSDFFTGDNDGIAQKESNSDIDEGEQELEINKQKVKKSVRFANVNDKESSSDDEESHYEEEVITKRNETQSTDKQSEFEQRQMRLKQQISKLENKSLTDAPWQLKGEVDASNRPQNSLLEEVVDFDLTTRPPPIITEKTTLTLEDIIRRRVKDKVWDDVLKKAKPVEDVLAYRKPEILDQSKSKLNLAQVYEAEYLKQKHGNIDEDPKEPESHQEIREAMSKLFSKLDALSHYHYTPKPAQPDVKIVTNTPAISMEEVAPVAASNAALLAPEEVKNKRKGELMSKEERTTTDKNRERRKKKKLQREKGKKDVEKKVGKFKMAEVKDTQTLKTSKAFFEHLNEDVNSIIKPGKLVKRKHFTNKGQ